MTTKDDLIVAILATVIHLVGYALIWVGLGWQVSLGVFFLAWGSNIDKVSRR